MTEGRDWDGCLDSELDPKHWGEDEARYERWRSFKASNPRSAARMERDNELPSKSGFRKLPPWWEDEWPEDTAFDRLMPVLKWLGVGLLTTALVAGAAWMIWG